MPHTQTHFNDFKSKSVHANGLICYNPNKLLEVNSFNYNTLKYEFVLISEQSCAIISISWWAWDSTEYMCNELCITRWMWGMHFRMPAIAIIQNGLDSHFKEKQNNNYKCT